MQHKNAVLKGLENLKENEITGTYEFNERIFSIDEMMEEVKNETATGLAFSQEIYDMVISFFASKK